MAGATNIPQTTASEKPAPNIFTGENSPNISGNIFEFPA
jgi:hypothetical protein